MKANDWKSRLGMVYSTDPDYKYQTDEQPEAETLPPQQQDLRVWRDSKQRAGKVVTLVRGFVGSEADLQELGRLVKKKMRCRRLGQGRRDHHTGRSPRPYCRNPDRQRVPLQKSWQLNIENTETHTSDSSGAALFRVGIGTVLLVGSRPGVVALAQADEKQRRRHIPHNGRKDGPPHAVLYRERRAIHRIRIPALGHEHTVHSAPRELPVERNGHVAAQTSRLPDLALHRRILDAHGPSSSSPTNTATPYNTTTSTAAWYAP